MAISDTSSGGGVRHVRCPKCHSVLQEPTGVPVYQCGGCGTSLRAKIRSGDAQAAAVSAAPSSESVLPTPRLSRSGRLGSGDVASTSAPASTPDAPTTVRHQGAGTTSPRETTGVLTPSRRHHVPSQAPPIVENKGHDHRSADRAEADGSSGRHRARGAVSAPSASANFSSDAAAEPVAATTKRGSGEVARPRSKDIGEAAPVSARAADSRSAPAAVSWKLRDDAEEKAPSPPPPRHAVQPQKMSPLHEKILKTVDELKDDLSELFSKSPELKPSTPPRAPRHPAQEGHASRPAIPTGRARHAAAAAALHRRGNAGHAGGDKYAQAAPRGLPSRRYRRCRADSCGGHDTRPAGSGTMPSARLLRSRARQARVRQLQRTLLRVVQSAAAPRAAAVEAKRRAPPPKPKHHCRPVLKGAPFIVCSSCFTLVQVPAGFAVASARVRDLRCGACSAVLSYSYRDPDRKKPVGSSPARPGAGARPDLFSFIEDFAGGVSSYSTTEDERPLHVSRNSSFDTVVAAGETVGARPHGNSLHRLMGYGSASELLLRRSPSLYEYGSFDKRSTPPSNASRRYDDRKGKAVCLESDDADAGDDDSDDGSALRRSNMRGAGLGARQGHSCTGSHQNQVVTEEIDSYILQRV